MNKHLITFTILLIMMSSAAKADWNFSGPPNSNAFIQTDTMTLELQCDRVRFAPASYQASQAIVAKQGLSFRFINSSSNEVAVFQAGSFNADIAIADNYPVEVRFFDTGSYGFVLDQIAKNSVLNLSMVDQNVSFGIFVLNGSFSAIKSLRASCGIKPQRTPSEPEPDLFFVRGYRGIDDKCQLVGETAFTIDFLDDAADFVACPKGSAAMKSLMVETGATVIAQTGSYSFFSIPNF